ncbi:gamma-glutamyltransferase [Nonomuraea africana]|uniref:Gamma-glutamyltranspeptidase/glutathione hydrolase n=1 Tax=Nonomuraea africana TaxID=46171 RepID=A0ABR9K6E9_9ACTN|nr:gamma-glutamyltransferase [Nonomuraea africana]MBE1557589.1 gamma-glutamyltranspeptidase/glutathione hydrolase [Nonomuraea africana]
MSYKNVARGRGAAAAAEDPRVLDAVKRILEAGGNAVDAAVAAAAIQGVCRPMSGGLGGGGFMLIRLPSGKTVVVEHREQATAAFGPESLVDDHGAELPNADRAVHGHSVGVPGAVRAWDEALRLYGRLSFAEVLAPSIELAREGFEVDATLGREIAERRDDFAMFEPTRRIYLTPDLQALPVGTWLRNPDLARAYELIAEQGAKVFYEGEIAEAIVRTVNEPPAAEGVTRPVRAGLMTLDDLTHYTVRHLEPVRYRFGDYEIAGPPLPSSGALTVGEALGVLDRLESGSLVHQLHRYLQVSRMVFVDRDAYLGDDRHVDVPAAALLSEDYLRARAAGIDSETAVPGDLSTGGAPWMSQEPDSPSTIHMTVDDGRGMTVSYTSTIVSMGGSGVVVPGLGFLLNDALAGRTAFRGGLYGSARPMSRMRPLSSMAPSTVERDGELVMALGSPGGTTIITTTLQILYLTLGAGMSLEEALAFPRVTQRNEPGGLALAEPAFLRRDFADELRALGHEFDVWQPVEGIGAANGIEFSANVTAVAEPVRRGGGAAAVWEL